MRNIKKCIYQEAFFFHCRPCYKSMQKTVLYKYTKCCTNEWNGILYNRCHSNCDLGRINLKICVDFSQSFENPYLYLQHLQLLKKNGSWKYLSWPFEHHSSHTAHHPSENIAIFALTGGTCLRLPAENASPSIHWLLNSQVCALGSSKPYSQHIQSSSKWLIWQLNAFFFIHFPLHFLEILHFQMPHFDNLNNRAFDYIWIDQCSEHIWKYIYYFKDC